MPLEENGALDMAYHTTLRKPIGRGLGRERGKKVGGTPRGTVGREVRIATRIRKQRLLDEYDQRVLEEYERGHIDL